MDALAQLVERQAIQDTLIRYAHALDSHCPELLDEVFAADADLDYRAAGGIRGDRDALRSWLAQAMGVFDSWQHLLSNFVISIGDGDAETMTSCYNPLQGLRPDGSPHVLHCGCRYQDRLRKTASGWRIIQRTLVMDWMDPPMPVQAAEMPQAAPVE